METYRSGHDSGRDQCAQCLQPAQSFWTVCGSSLPMRPKRR
jgi:hypothetical protein